VAGLLLAQHRGTEAAKIALVAGFNRLCEQGRATTPSPRDALH
jgi:glutamine phosphoribosylpyrophosphate amidotransferase